MRALVGYIKSIFQVDTRFARNETSKHIFELIDYDLNHLALEIKEVEIDIEKTRIAIEQEARLLILSRRSSSIKSRRSSSIPPQLGERMLLLILKKDERVNIPGDLAEEYGEIAVKHGARFAKVWYYKQVAASAWPMIRKGVRWGVLASVGEWIRRII